MKFYTGFSTVVTSTHEGKHNVTSFMPRNQPVIINHKVCTVQRIKQKKGLTQAELTEL